MKPIKLLAPLIQNSSKTGQLIADGFLGSGSTMVAAHQLNRKCYGMELDPKYCQVIIDRMLKLDPSLTIKRNGKKYIRINEITT
jgi:DNA modification methylase